jgi:hypothetical protein
VCPVEFLSHFGWIYHYFSIPRIRNGNICPESLYLGSLQLSFGFYTDPQFNIFFKSQRLLTWSRAGTAKNMGTLGDGLNAFAL